MANMCIGGRVEVKREQPNECDIVTNGRNPKEIKTRAKVTKMCKETYATHTQNDDWG